MSRFQRPIRALQTLPAPVRWLAPPVALLACTGAVLMTDATYLPPLSAPTPVGQSAAYCTALIKALPAAVHDHPRADPPNSPYVAVWQSSPRTVLRCGVARPASLDKHGGDLGPYVNDVQWYVEGDGHGGYRYTSTLRAVYVEVAVPAGAFPHAVDPLSDVSSAIDTIIPSEATG